MSSSIVETVLPPFFLVHWHNYIYFDRDETLSDVKLSCWPNKILKKEELKVWKSEEVKKWRSIFRNVPSKSSDSTTQTESKHRTKSHILDLLAEFSSSTHVSSSGLDTPIHRLGVRLFTPRWTKRFINPSRRSDDSSRSQLIAWWSSSTGGSKPYDS